jgi:hypothetical protein
MTVRSWLRHGLCAAPLIVAGLLAVGCGENNPGEPRSLARELGVPAAGDANVYCVPDHDPEFCDVRLQADADASDEDVGAWWIRVARAARATGTFSYKGSRWRWRAVTLTQKRDGDVESLGWRCRGDAGQSARVRGDRMWAREPWRPTGITSIAVARARGCTLAVYPPPQETPPAKTVVDALS